MDIYPDTGAIPIDLIKHRDLIDVLRKIAARGAYEIGKRDKAQCH